MIHTHTQKQHKHKYENHGKSGYACVYIYVYMWVWVCQKTMAWVQQMSISILHTYAIVITVILRRGVYVWKVLVCYVCAVV